MGSKGKVKRIHQRTPSPAEQKSQQNGRGKTDFWLAVIIAFLLAMSTVVAYRSVMLSDFVEFDDNQCVFENQHVLGGLNWPNVKWAFSDIRVGLWVPMVWLSYMVDAQIGGRGPKMFHLTNLVLHITNTLLLFALLRYASGSTWRSAFVAALFALHPLHVESVAWITERKDVLSSFFWLAALLAYCFYVKRPSISRYVLVGALFLMGIMSKPMILTLPFTLMLLDYWPLNRLEVKKNVQSHEIPWTRVILEKLPLIVITIIPAVLAYVGQRKFGSLKAVPWDSRIETAVVSYMGYLVKMVWPVNLAVHYPHPGSFPVGLVVVSFLALAFVTAIAIVFGLKRRYVAMGWMWYVITLAPVSGLVVYGVRSLMPDRYTYIPLIGLFIVVAWGIPDLLFALYKGKGIRNVLGEFRIASLALVVLALFILVALIIRTSSQVAYWKNSQTLFEQAIRVNPRNSLMHNNLAKCLLDKGNLSGAIFHSKEALKYDPISPAAHNNLGIALARQGDYHKAISHYLEAVRIKSDYAEAMNNLGWVLFQQGRLKEAVRYCSKALRLNPEYAGAANNLGVIAVAQGKLDDAVRYFSLAIKLNPYDPSIHCNLAVVWYRKGEYERAWAEVHACQDLGGVPPPDFLTVLSKQMPKPRK